MFIQDMFREDIYRKINGVIKVDQDNADVIEQEVKEYVITKELKKHFTSFFNDYAASFDTPTADIGVWISGFFGSGKSHFLKMLSYILENREIHGRKTVERFREKFEDDSDTYILIDKSTKAQTETILFNIDIESSIKKDETAVVRVIAKVFYQHLGFYGEDLKVAKLEKYIEKEGKTEEFRRVFEKYKGKPWLDQRKAYAFNGKAVVATMVEVLGMSEDAAQAWLKDKSGVEDFSISVLVEDICEYIKNKPKNFRLLFMIDEVGQYIGENTSLLLNLQSIVEKLSSECQGKVWVICTGQEAIDDIIKVRTDEFSRIQARFKTRLTLTSSSVDEVIQKRILRKTEDATHKLETIYHQNDSVLRNLFTFTHSTLDIRGFSEPREFCINFPFVPYQFIMMQKIFAEIKKHGNTGKHFSVGERSMLSGFQEAAQTLCKAQKDEYALVPFYLFYDTVHSFLDGTIRRVIERCQKAADAGNGIQNDDVNVLKLLYLIRYVENIRSSLDNIVILMADDIRTDKLTNRELIQKSLDRLLSQNYIRHTGDCYHFLTDEEQEIQREIKNTPVDTSAIVESISQIIYGEIYPHKKYRYRNKYDLYFDQRVDDIGNMTDHMALRFVTNATDSSQKDDIQLMVESKRNAVIVLDDVYGYDCYQAIEFHLKIEKYIKQCNVTQLPKSIQDIIQIQRVNSKQYKMKAIESLQKAIVNARFFIGGDRHDLNGNDAKAKIEQTLEKQVAYIYTKLDLIDKNYEKDHDIKEILNGKVQNNLQGELPNLAAATDICNFLEIQAKRKMPTLMSDIHMRYQKIPYGWREIDIAAAVALLIYQQKITIQYDGQTIKPDHPNIIHYLRKKTEIGKTQILKRESASASHIRQVRTFLRDYLEVMDVPEDENELADFIIQSFNAQKIYYSNLLQHYIQHPYPDQERIKSATLRITHILNHQSDNIALFKCLIENSDNLLDQKEDLQNVEDFFKTQVQVFDNALHLLAKLHNDRDYLAKDAEISQAIQQIEDITAEQQRFNYKKIPHLNPLMKTVADGHLRMLLTKRDELKTLITQCLNAIHEAASNQTGLQTILQNAQSFYNDKLQRMHQLESLALLDALTPQIIAQKDTCEHQIQNALCTKTTSQNAPQSALQTIPYRSISRSVLFSAAKLQSPKDVEQYIDKIRQKLLTQLKNGPIDLN